MDRTKICGLTFTLLALLSGGCGPKKPKVIVGSKNFTEQVVLGEIVAQHLERRLGRPIERKLNLTGTLITYQALQAGEIALYPEYTGTIQAEILKETPGTEASIMWERVRNEMHRVAQTEVFEPLGIDNRFVMVARTSDAAQLKAATLSEAAQVKGGWRLGVGYEFQSRSDGMPLLNKYHLPMAAAPRSMDLGLLFKALSEAKGHDDRGERHRRPARVSRFHRARGRSETFPAVSGVPDGTRGRAGRRARPASRAKGTLRKVHQRNHAQAQRAGGYRSPSAARRRCGVSGERRLEVIPAHFRHG
jgi:hypothetical protein